MCAKKINRKKQRREDEIAMVLHTRLLEVNQYETLSLKEVVTATSWRRNSLS